MNSITSFIELLDLLSPQAQFLNSRLGGDSNLEAFLGGKDHEASVLIKLACLSADVCLGADSVETTPMNNTEVDSNWYVPFLLVKSHKLRS